MRTGSDALWDVAGALGIVPSPPDRHLAEMLARWWSMGRTFGCVSARSSAWFVITPDPRIWCGSCAADRFGAERRCAYCLRPVRLKRASTLLFEMVGDIRVLGRAHQHCEQRARRRP